MGVIRWKRMGLKRKEVSGGVKEWRYEGGRRGGITGRYMERWKEEMREG